MQGHKLRNTQGHKLRNMQGHGDDWEHITVNFVRDGKGEYVQDSVTWLLSIILLNLHFFPGLIDKVSLLTSFFRFQHSGWYTRQNFEASPDVFIGKVLTNPTFL